MTYSFYGMICNVVNVNKLNNNKNKIIKKLFTYSNAYTHKQYLHTYVFNYVYKEAGPKKDLSCKITTIPMNEYILRLDWHNKIHREEGLQQALNKLISPS